MPGTNPSTPHPSCFLQPVCPRPSPNCRLSIKPHGFSTIYFERWRSWDTDALCLKTMRVLWSEFLGQGQAGDMKEGRDDGWLWVLWNGFGRDYRHCQTQWTAGARINRSAPHVFSFCLIPEQQTTRKHESPCQTIMGHKNTSYIVCRWCKSIMSYQAKKTRAMEKCWSQVAEIFPKGICISLFSFIAQIKHILTLHFADCSSCTSLIFKNTSYHNA